MLTRGVWEQCPDEKLLEIIRDANEPEEVLYRTEDWILERQETAEIDNYTMAVTFVRKVYQSPKKPWTLKKILMVVIPVVLVVGGISIALFLGHRSIQNKEKELAECMEDGETYFQNDNYQRAVEEYGEAEELADSLKREEEALLADQYKQVAEQIILADETLAAGEYEKAQELYLTAGEMSQKAGNVGKDYIDSQLERAKDYIAVYDLIALGERKEEYGNLEGAVAAYKEAREKAADIYYSEGKTEALEKQAAAEEAMEKRRWKKRQEKRSRRRLPRRKRRNSNRRRKQPLKWRTSRRRMISKTQSTLKIRAICFSPRGSMRARSLSTRLRRRFTEGWNWMSWQIT